MKNKRNQLSGSFITKVALNAIKGEKTLSELTVWAPLSNMVRSPNKKSHQNVEIRMVELSGNDQRN